MRTLKNWNDQINFSVPESRFKTPENIAEVQAIVKKAYQDSQKISVIGAMHSTTECMVGDECIISLKNMNQILRIDRTNQTITVQAGVTLTRLSQALKPVDLQPPVNLEFGNYHIGAISGTHANDTSLNRESQFSSFVVGVKLVTPKGDLLEVSESKNTELLPIIRSHFGLFGVVCEITVRVFENEPMFITAKIVSLDHMIEHFDDEIESLRTTQDQAFGMLFPYSRNILWECRKFVSKDTAAKRSRLKVFLDRIQAQGSRWSTDLLLPFIKIITKISTVFNASTLLDKLASSSITEKSLRLFRIGGYIIDPCDRGLVYKESGAGFDFYDWLFPEDQWTDMLRDFLQLCEEFRRKRNFVLSLPTLVYFVPKDNSSILSRSRKSNMMTIDPTFPNPENKIWKDFRTAFNEIAVAHNGIPHINKTRGGAIHHFAASIDSRNRNKYLKKRKELDTKNLFLNDYFKQLYDIS